MNRSALLLGLGLAGAAGTAAFCLRLASQLRPCEDPCVELSTLRRFEPHQASLVYDRFGREIGRFSVEDRRVAPLTAVPEHVRRAVLAIEDARFYRHRGIDYRRVVGAALANLRAGEITEGASTITMQLARNVYPDALPPRERSYQRKLREMQTALEIERALPKDTILQHYLNTIYLGSGAYGLDAAARRYFGKPIGEVTLAEGALLAALPREPSAINPFRSPGAARRRRDLVLDRMLALGWVTDSAWSVARHSPVLVVGASSDSGLVASANVAGYFVEGVRRELQADFGPALYRAGLRIHTTLDAGLQRMAEQAIEAEIVRLERREHGRAPRPARAGGLGIAGARTTPYLQAGMVVLEADSGDVLVMVGGRSFAESPFNRMTQARRQPGSVFKPFVYAAALREGWLPADSISDAAVAIVMPAGNVWRPENYDRRERNGSVTLETALAKSLNRATVRLGMRLGVSRVTEAAESMGLGGPLPVRPSTLLGAAEVRPIDLIAAYAPLARADGNRLRPRSIVRVLDSRGRVLLERGPEREPGLEPQAATGLRGMLVEAVERGTGRQVRAAGYEGPVAGKTGTTNGTTNAWFVGVTPDYVTGVWVGFDRPKAILPDGQATGGRIAAPIWAEVMRSFPKYRDEWPAPASAEPSLVDPERGGEQMRDQAEPEETSPATVVAAAAEHPSGPGPDPCAGACAGLFSRPRKGL